MPAKVLRKILKSGDSKVTALPPNWLRAFNLDVGDRVEILYDSIVLIKAKDTKLDSNFLKKEFEILTRLENDEEKNQPSKNERSSQGLI